MTETDRYRGLLTISVILDGILEKERTMLHGHIERGEETERNWKEKDIRKLELSRDALGETRRMVPVENQETA